MSILSYFNVDRKTELKLRAKKAEAKRVTKRTLKVLEQNRIKQYEESLSSADIISDFMTDCVEAVCAHVDEQTGERIELKKGEEVIIKQEVPEEIRKKIVQRDQRRKRKHF